MMGQRHKGLTLAQHKVWGKAIEAMRCAVMNMRCTNAYPHAAKVSKLMDKTMRDLDSLKCWMEEECQKDVGEEKFDIDIYYGHSLSVPEDIIKLISGLTKND